MKLAPALIALLIFIGILMYFFYPRITEKYTNPTEKQLECERVYQDCYSNAGTPADCTIKMNECLGITPSSTTTTSTTTVPTSSSQPIPNTTDVAASPESNSLLNQQLLQSILQNITGSSGTTPSNSNLTMIQGGSIANPTPVTGEQVQAAYKAYQQVIKPHQQLPEYKSNVAITVPTDKGTLAEKIREETVATPSIQQNIRQEIDDVVKDELNPYFVSYTMN
jgi:hypothetical protein